MTTGKTIALTRWTFVHPPLTPHLWQPLSWFICELFFFPIIIFILHKNWSCEIYPSLTYSLSIMPSRSIHVDKWQDFLLFYCSVIFHCIYTTFLYLFIHQWALQLLPCVYTGVMMGVQKLFWVSVFLTFFYLFFYMKSYMLCPCIVQRSWNCIYSSLWSNCIYSSLFTCQMPREMPFSVPQL